MSLGNWLRSKEIRRAATLAALSSLTIACNNASALPVVPLDRLLPAPESVSAGTQTEGYALGRRTGEIIVNRLSDRTVGTEGCSAIGRLESALVQVTRNIRRPQGDDDLVRGFYRGYLDAVRGGIRNARTVCDNQSYASGEFAGQLYGALLCEVSKVSLDLATSIELESLYDGWSGGSVDVIQECRTTANLTLQDCEGAEPDLLQLSIEKSCSDTVL